MNKVFIMDYQLLISQLSTEKLISLSQEIERELIKRNLIYCSIDISHENEKLFVTGDGIGKYMFQINDLCSQYGSIKYYNLCNPNKIMLIFNDIRDRDDLLSVKNYLIEKIKNNIY